ncbi:MAG: HAMP domain-containing histidine kinase [Lachnospiraceae bacterium]|nr:HAMP domain-containing histidine kinase [Lachnospiraceae bacterium]
MKRIRIKTSLSLYFVIVVAITVFFASIFSRIFISRQFEEYVKKNQKKQADELAENIGSNYNDRSGGFNIDYIHGMGMYALKDGFIIKLYDKDKNLLWDAENHDMALCHYVMNAISARMEEKRPELKGEFVTYTYSLKNMGEDVGSLDISYYTPYYLDENEFGFIDALNIILSIVGAVALIIAVTLGMLLAGRITKPILGVIKAAGKISEGDYETRVNTDLKERETFELADAVNNMAAALREQEFLRNELTKDLAHELRTPVTNVSSYVEMMADGVMEPTKERLLSCYEELSRLGVLISDLERLEKVEADKGNLKKEDFDIYELAESVLKGFESVLSDKNIIAKTVGKETHIFADKTRISQVITNLVSNAVKYTDNNGKITVFVEEHGENLQITVEDTGIGIPEKDLPRVFERFYRTDRSRTRKTGGVGIGLSITKAIVQAHNGNIYCESTPGEGSRFIVNLPVK